jgi:hypothetical protein
MATGLALPTLIAAVLLFDRVRRARTSRALLNALTAAGATSGDQFFHTLTTPSSPGSRV